MKRHALARREPVPRRDHAQGAPARPRPRRLAELQRVAGNAAVARLLGSAAPRLQRAGELVPYAGAPAGPAPAGNALRGPRAPGGGGRAPGALATAAPDALAHIVALLLAAARSGELPITEAQASVLRQLHRNLDAELRRWPIGEAAAPDEQPLMPADLVSLSEIVSHILGTDVRRFIGSNDIYMPKAWLAEHPIDVTGLQDTRAPSTGAAPARLGPPAPEAAGEEPIPVVQLLGMRLPFAPFASGELAALLRGLRRPRGRVGAGALVAAPRDDAVALLSRMLPPDAIAYLKRHSRELPLSWWVLIAARCDGVHAQSLMGLILEWPPRTQAARIAVVRAIMRTPRERHVRAILELQEHDYGPPGAAVSSKEREEIGQLRPAARAVRSARAAIRGHFERRAADMRAVPLANRDPATLRAARADRAREQNNASTADASIARVYRRARLLHDRLVGLGLNPGTAPLLAYPEEGSRRLSDANLAAVTARCAVDTAKVNARLTALRPASWTLLMVGDAVAQAALLPVEAALAAAVFDADATQKEVAAAEPLIQKAWALDLFRDQFDEINKQPQANVFPKDMAIAFARANNLDVDEWKTYQKFYKEVVQERRTPPPPPDGTLTLGALNAFTTGTTAGQRYWPKSDRGWGVWSTHVSIAFTFVAGGQRVRITQIHVSFKNGNVEPRYWWNAHGATLTRQTPNFTSGAGHVAGMPAKAVAMVNEVRARLNLNPAP